MSTTKPITSSTHDVEEKVVTEHGGAAPNMRRIGLITLLLFVFLAIVGTVPRVLRHREIIAATHEQEPTVIVATARRAPATGTLSVPGTIQAVRETSIYARTSGYVRRWLVDIGSTVRAGDELAELDTPELDQELGQARASRAQVQAALELATATLARWKQLVDQDAATKQEFDEKQAAFNAASANAAASQANLQRLTELKRFSRITAPFSGIVTARNVEVGALVQAGAGAGARPLFTIAQPDSLRIMINLPENSATSAKPGMTAEVVVREVPNRVFTATVTRSARALDPVTRTMLTQLDLSNRDHALLPGTFAQVNLKLPRAIPPVLIPANALMIRSEGPIVAVVRNQHVHLQPVALGRDYGKEIEVISGLEDGAQIVINPGDEAVEGAAVKTKAAK